MLGGRDRWSSGRARQGVGALVTVVAVVVVGGLLASVLLPSMCRPRETAKRARCASNLHQVGLAIQQYADDHGGRYPASLAELVTAETGLTAGAFVCPSGDDEASTAKDSAGIAADLAASAAGGKHCLSYVYLGGGLTTSTVTPTSVLAYESINDHDDQGLNVLFGDGHAEWLSPGGWQKVAADAGLVVRPTNAVRP